MNRNFDVIFEKVCLTYFIISLQPFNIFNFCKKYVKPDSVEWGEMERWGEMGRSPHSEIQKNISAPISKVGGVQTFPTSSTVINVFVYLASFLCDLIIIIIM